MAGLSRRQLLALGAAGMALPLRALAAGPGDRKFLFVFANGGWDPTYCFAPSFDKPAVDTEPDATVATAHGISFVDSERRPAVRTFFETWGDRAAVLHGLEVRSISHTRARRLLFTGTALESGDDWGSRLAAGAPSPLTLPYLVASGPAFNAALQDQSVRVGSHGQLAELLDGSALSRSDMPVVVPSAGSAARIEAFVHARVAAAAAGVKRGREADYTRGYLESLDRVQAVRDLGSALSIPSAGTAPQLAALALDAMELGLTRCALVQHDGWKDLAWDTHSNNFQQSEHFQTLFADLVSILHNLEGRVAPSGALLADELTIVVFSELGRHPQENANLGKDHWTYTSAMVLGAGVRGGQVVGGYDDNLFGRPVDLASGAPTDSGTPLVAPHFGATLLALGDLDPADYGLAEAPIDALLA